MTKIFVLFFLKKKKQKTKNKKQKRKNRIEIFSQSGVHPARPVFFLLPIRRKSRPGPEITQSPDLIPSNQKYKNPKWEKKIQYTKTTTI
jgi:hypothetical protein